jgi:hypothetical protein
LKTGHPVHSKTASAHFDPGVILIFKVLGRISIHDDPIFFNKKEGLPLHFKWLYILERFTVVTMKGPDRAIARAQVTMDTPGRL